MKASSSHEKHHHHAIFLSLALQGHVNPAVGLALKLASRGFTITFLVFETVHQQITQARTHHGGGTDSDDIFEGARAGAEGVDIRYRVISDGLPLDFDRQGRLDEYLEWYLHGGMYGKVEEGVGEIMLGSQPMVNVFIADTFYPWASKIAKKFGLSYASFWTQPALVFNLYYHLHLLRDHGHYGCPDIRYDPIDYIPGVESLEQKDLISHLKDNDTPTNMHKYIFQVFQDVRSADYVLCNTVQDLEPQPILALQAQMPFYSIGPILLSGPTESIVPTNFLAQSSCIEWLEPKAHGSVLYVSFGSLASFTKDVVLEIAYGLVLSNVDFVWVLRPNTVVSKVDDLLPVGFEEEVRGRGIVVSWTNQIAVLSHPAVGGFLTHCGWNSILQSIWCNIPMLCFPIFTDQPTNRKIVVDDWKVGIDLSDGNPIKREKIAAKIKNFLGLKVGDDLRKNIGDVKKMFENALGANGSSEKNLDLFIEQLKK